MKYIKKYSQIKYIAFALLIAFSSMLSFCYYALNNNLTLKAKQYSNALANAKNFNEEYNNNTCNKQVLTNEAIYSDGLTALLTSYENFTKLDKFEVFVNGYIKADASVVSYDIEIQSHITKENGKIVSIVSLYCPTSAARCSSGKCIVYNGIVEKYETDNVTKVNNKIIPDFTNSTYSITDVESYKEKHGTAPGELYYIITEKTVKEILNFYVKKDISGNILGYNTSFILSPTLSTIKYAKMLAGVMEGSKNYVFSNCRGSLELYGDGSLKTIQTQEQFTLDFNLFGDAYWPVTCNSSLTFNVML